MAFGAVLTGDTLIKKRKSSNSKPTLMLSRLPLLLTDSIVRSLLVIAARHNMLGVSSLSVRIRVLTKTATGTGTPKELGGHCSMGA